MRVRRLHVTGYNSSAEAFSLIGARDIVAIIQLRENGHRFDPCLELLFQVSFTVIVRFRSHRSLDLLPPVTQKTQGAS